MAATLHHFAQDLPAGIARYPIVDRRRRNGYETERVPFRFCVGYVRTLGLRPSPVELPTQRADRPAETTGQMGLGATGTIGRRAARQGRNRTWVSSRSAGSHEWDGVQISIPSTQG